MGVEDVVRNFIPGAGLLIDALGGGASESSRAPAAPPPIGEPVKEATESAQRKSEARRRKLKTQGRQSTFAAGSAGIVGPANVQRKTLLGQ